ncbi:uroporphyrinogen-III C-methyltransferase [Intrasporangium sp. DVR]|uniref:uroporphyrinogen-III C-methyltransferase n=1 Tax=Intrasporangium sp. DVR TaxID=3127867 RepID=UPI00313A5A10
MLIETDLTGVPVVVVGVPSETGPVVERYERCGAVVSVWDQPAAAGVADVAAAGAGHTGARLAVVVGRARSWPETTGLRKRCIVVEEPAASLSRGRVVLVGAGPGGPGTMTVDAVRALADADVVLADRLASVGDLARFAPGAEIVDVGKRPGHHAVPQREIEALMVERAQQGLTVVRLKGGDPYVFGRGSEEVAAAVAAGLPVTVVPGVTSAVAVPGAAGIPVTQREVSHLFTVVSGHAPLTSEQAASLARLGGTIVFLMGVQNLVPLTSALLAAGLDRDTPAAVVERGLTPDMRSLTSPLGRLAEEAAHARVSAPAVIVIGDVVRQSDVWARRLTVREPSTSGTGTGPGERAQRHTASGPERVEAG